jgi:hypothetical protein
MPLFRRCLVLVFLAALPALAQDRAADLKTAFAGAQHRKRGMRGRSIGVLLMEPHTGNLLRPNAQARKRAA